MSSRMSSAGYLQQIESEWIPGFAFPNVASALLGADSAAGRPPGTRLSAEEHNNLVDHLDLLIAMGGGVVAVWSAGGGNERRRYCYLLYHSCAKRRIKEAVLQRYDNCFL
jgi:hypothetical protein